jgi:hypothetical protein
VTGSLQRVVNAVQSSTPLLDVVPVSGCPGGAWQPNTCAAGKKLTSAVSETGCSPPPLPYYLLISAA